MANIDDTPIHVGEDLGAAGAHMRAVAGHIEGELQQLRNKLQPLVESWRNSKAAAYYEEMQTEWNTASEGLFGEDGVLGRIAHVMDVNWGNYCDGEWANIKTWQH